MNWWELCLVFVFAYLFLGLVISRVVYLRHIRTCKACKERGSLCKKCEDDWDFYVFVFVAWSLIGIVGGIGAAGFWIGSQVDKGLTLRERRAVKRKQDYQNAAKVLRDAGMDIPDWIEPR